MKRISVALALTLLSATALLAQVAGDPSKPLLDNEQIRVRELRLKPGFKSPAQDNPNTFLYALTDGSLVFAPPGRTAYELTFKTGEALWLPSQTTTTANETDKEIRALVVEVKARPVAAAKAKKGRSKGKGGSKKGGGKAASDKK